MPDATWGGLTLDQALSCLRRRWPNATLPGVSTDAARYFAPRARARAPRTPEARRVQTTEEQAAEAAAAAEAHATAKNEDGGAAEEEADAAARKPTGSGPCAGLASSEAAAAATAEPPDHASDKAENKWATKPTCDLVMNWRIRIAP